MMARFRCTGATLVVISAALLAEPRADGGGPRKDAMQTSSLPPVVDVSFGREEYATAHRGERAGIALWNLGDEAQAEPRRWIAPRGLDGGPARVALSPDGSKLLVAAQEPSQPLFLVNARTGATTARLPGPTARVAALAWSADGRWLGAVGEDPGAPPPGAKAHPTKSVAYVSAGRAHLFAVADPKAPRFVLAGPAQPAAALAFAPDGKQVAVLFGNGACAIWSLDSGQLVHQVDLGSRGYAMAYSPDKKTLAVALAGPDGNGSVVEMLDSASLARKALLTPLPPLVAHLGFASDGARLAVTAFEAVSVWDVGAGRELTEVDYSMSTGKDPRGAAFVAAGLLVVGGEHRVWQLWGLGGARPQAGAGLRRP
jgi:WD40 repeat protein